MWGVAFFVPGKATESFFFLMIRFRACDLNRGEYQRNETD